MSPFLRKNPGYTAEIREQQFENHVLGEVTSRLTADTQTMSDTVALNVNVFLR
jgi:hypothetical protein